MNEYTKEQVQETIESFGPNKGQHTSSENIILWAAKEYLKTLEEAEKSRWNRMQGTGWSNE